MVNADRRVLHQRIKKDGAPENSTLFPCSFPTALSSLHLLDLTAHIYPGSTLEDLSQTERHRLRSFICLCRGDQSLLQLSDAELDKTLGFITSDARGNMHPTLCGLLMIGEPARLKDIVPSIGAVFQHLDGTRVTVNDDLDLPIIACFEQMMIRFREYNPEQEKYIGPARVVIPDFAEQAFREGLVNAFCHRDYGRLGRIRVTITESRLEISNPGGFITGISSVNVLTAEPRGRNPALADAMKRIGLAEKTGRGVDVIFESTLRNGRPWPSYSGSSEENILLSIPKYGADFDFLQRINLCETKRGSSLPILPMMILSVLHNEGGELNLDDLLRFLPKDFDRGYVRSVADQLASDGALSQSGRRINPNYTLSPLSAISAAGELAGKSAAPAAADLNAREQAVLDLVRKNGKASRKEIAESLGIHPQATYRLLSGLTGKGLLAAEGEKRLRTYTLRNPQR